MRPPLDSNISLADFQDFYWLKTELIAFCKSHKMPTPGSKIALSNRIAHFLQFGEIQNIEKQKISSKFDWANAVLTPDTVLTDSYKNGVNTRNFFRKHIGAHFHFNVPFMAWIKENYGKTLQDAIIAWQSLKQAQNQQTEKTDIAPQFEFNQYVRDFLADNPSKTKKDAIACWNIKKLQRGSKKYQKTDSHGHSPF
jgi:hypothetical protein